LGRGFRWRVWDEQKIKIWDTPRLPDDDNPYLITLKPDYHDDSVFKDLKHANSLECDVEILNDMLYHKDVELVDCNTRLLTLSSCAFNFLFNQAKFPLPLLQFSYFNCAFNSCNSIVILLSMEIMNS